MLSRYSYFRSSGFTLIELILALGLSAVLLALLASALSLGISRAVGSREAVERVRLVEGIVSLMRSDVDRTVIYDPQDTSVAMSLAEASAEFDVDSIDEISSGSGGRSSSGGTGSRGGGSGGSSTGSPSSDSAAGSQTISLRRPLGIYGTIDELQVDVLREHQQFEIDETGNVVAPLSISGITTVRYAIGQGTATLGLSAGLENQQLSSGLIRQEVNRDMLNWAEQSGSAASLTGPPQLVAPEVSRLEFRYFDGVQLLDTWDTQLTEGVLPRAIEVRMWFLEEDRSSGNEEVVTRRESAPYVLTMALPSTWNTPDMDVVGVTSDATSATGTPNPGGTGGSR